MRARKHKAVKENGERWLLTYSDLITLLMIFFIILYSTASTNKKKFEDLTGALTKAFNNGAYQVITIGGTAGTPKNFRGGTVPSERKAFKQMKEAMARISRQLGLQSDVVHVGTMSEGIDVTLAGSLLFYPGDTGLKPSSLALLGRIVQVARHLPNTIRVQANTDEQAGTDGGAGAVANWTLSTDRAVSIVTYMSSKGGVPPARLVAAGLGQYHPVASNATPEGRARNRRADIIILYPPAGPAGSTGSAGGS